MVDAEVFQQILDQVALQLAQANADGSLYEKLIPFGLQGLVGEDEDIDLGSCDSRLGDIYVLGACSVKKRILLSFADNMGYDQNRFRFVEYDSMHQFDVSSLRYSTSVAAVMCGPVPHKAAEMGDVSSVLERLRHSEEGYPPLVELRDSSGKLGITKTSFQDGLSRLLKSGAIKANRC